MSDDFNARLRKKIMATFEQEAKERLQAITSSLLALENNPPKAEADSLLVDIFREAHTLKGSARGLELEDVGKIAHKMENVFSKVQNGTLAADGALFDVVYRSLDDMGALVQSAASGSESTVNVDEVCSLLEQLVTKDAAPAAAEPAPAPPSEAELPDKKKRDGKSSTTQKPTRSALIKAELYEKGSKTGSGTHTQVEITEYSQKPAAAALVPQPPPAPQVTEPVPVAKAAAKVAETMVLAKAAPKAADETVRVAISKLDSLMAQVGEIQVTRVSTLRRLNEITLFLDIFEAWEVEWNRMRTDCRHILRAGEESETEPAAKIGNVPRNLPAYLRNSEQRLKNAVNQMNLLKRNFKADSRRMAQVVVDLQDEVRRIRMLPIATVFQTFPRMIRDLSRELDKEIDFVVTGGENEMDRSVIEQISGPLVHLLRNCVDHGLEMPDVRSAAGKPRKGKLNLTASQRGGSILIEVSDDGAGIDAVKVKASAVKKGAITAEAAATMTEREAIWLVFKSGVSTRAAITEISGRGVGMDAVRENVERLNGIIDIETQVGKGTRFSISLPLTVATTLSLMIQTGGLVFALPVANVVRVMRVKPEQIGRASGKAVLHADGRHLAVVSLSDTLGLKSDRPNSGNLLAIIVGFVEDRVAFLVDSVIGTQEVMTKALPKPLYKVPYIGGATILGTGEVVIILNAADLVRGTSKTSPLIALTKQEAPKKRKILVVDDSATIRTMQQNILQQAGYQVVLAADGLEAWNLLKSDATCEAVLSDVNMPRMDGFELATRIRGEPRLKDLPIVLLTSLSSPEDREKGIRAGADAYIVKSNFDQSQLLSTIAGLI